MTLVAHRETAPALSRVKGADNSHSFLSTLAEVTPFRGHGDRDPLARGPHAKAYRQHDRRIRGIESCFLSHLLSHAALTSQRAWHVTSVGGVCGFEVYHRFNVGGPALVIRGRPSPRVEGEVAPVDICTLQHLRTVFIPLLASEEEVVDCFSCLSTRALI
jgi:hypothetical protein